MKRLSLILLVTGCCLRLTAEAQLGEIGLNPLQLEVGARPLAMGAAFVALADDVNATLYNPAGLAWSKGLSLTLRSFENLTAVQAYPTGNNSSFGLAVIKSKISDLPIAAGLATSNSNVVLLSYGTKLSFLPLLYRQDFFKRLGVGLNLKGLFEQTLRRSGQSDRSATGWELDLGLLWKAADWWSAGLALQNFLPQKALGGGEIKWNVGAAEGIPLTAKLATSARVIGDISSPVFLEGRELTVGAELNFTNSQPLLLRLGGEWGFNKTYFLRTGIMQQWRPAGPVANLNFGFGWRGEMWGVDLVTYREPWREEGTAYFSVLYFPKDWVVAKKLDVDRPLVFLEAALEKISLTDNIVTYDEKIEIVGKVKAGVEVYVNDLPAATAGDHTFKTVVPLQPGKNLIVVEARFEAEKKAWKYKVLRQSKIEVAEEKEIKKELARAVGVEEKEKLKNKEQEIKQRRQKVEELVTIGVLEVSPEAEFRLDASITRGELASWLVKAAGLRLPKVEADLFSDVPRAHPQAPFIKLVVEAGFLRPFADGTFRPNSPVSKEEGEQLFSLLKKAQR